MYKGFGQKNITYLETAWKSRVTKKGQKHQNITKKMNAHTDKDLKSKNFRGKSLFTSQGYQIKRKFEFKAKKVCLKKANFFRSP